MIITDRDGYLTIEGQINIGDLPLDIEIAGVDSQGMDTRNEELFLLDFSDNEEAFEFLSDRGVTKGQIRIEVAALINEALIQHKS